MCLDIDLVQVTHQKDYHLQGTIKLQIDLMAIQILTTQITKECDQWATMSLLEIKTIIVKRNQVSVKRRQIMTPILETQNTHNAIGRNYTTNHHKSLFML